MSDSEASPEILEEARPDEMTVQVLRDMANRLRIHFIKTTCASSSGHPTSCSSAAEIMSVLFFHTMRYKQTDPENPNNDRFILSKRLSFIDMAIGWLGQGLGAACGMAYTGKYFDRASYRVFCLLGDGEASEGSVWEALAFAAYHSLDNLVLIFDVNRLGHGGTLPVEHCIEAYQKRCKAFGWNTYVVDGRDVEALCQVFWQATQVKGKPTAVVAKTFKGRGMPNVEDAESWYGKPMPKERADAIIKLIESQIQTNRNLVPELPIEDSRKICFIDTKMTSPPVYKIGDKMSTRKACGLALAKLGRENDRVIVLDGDTKNSTFSELFKKEHPERFIECFIAEQNMVNVALGCAIRNRTIPFANNFAVFWTRAYDQIRKGAMSHINLNLIGSHCGVYTGEDSPSQMALEDLAMFRAIPKCTIFYPSDAVSTEHAVYLAANIKGLCFIRASYAETAVIYPPLENFHIGQAKVVRQSTNDKVVVIAAGVCLHEALLAATELAEEDIYVRVIDLFTIKPLDSGTILINAKATGGRIITVEDHYPEGGIGEAVCAAVSMEKDILVHQMAVSQMPQSRRTDEPLDMFGISASHIMVAVKCILVY
ncbi:transketolase-like protein 1 [Dipodomys spectabilis]|uniref:transketolase-like protein 1 n=1 Tax=Dipodomys spectabilis TaxID=105255 RepID=UPI001C53962C|nr:transketolase-like protein 1 [Dipodomys spectabilis]